MDIKDILNNAQSVINLAEEKGWSEEELAKVIELLHYHFENGQSIQLF